jgi:hypothetical protein
MIDNMSKHFMKAAMNAGADLLRIFKKKLSLALRLENYPAFIRG